MWAKYRPHLFYEQRSIYMAKKKSTTNKIRLTVCGLYVAQIFFLTCGFYQFTVEGKGTDFYSCFTGIFYSISSGNVQVAIQAIIVALIPMLGFLIFSFDKKRNIKKYLWCPFLSTCSFPYYRTYRNAFRMGFCAFSYFLLPNSIPFINGYLLKHC